MVLHFCTHISKKIFYVYFTDLYNFYPKYVSVGWLLGRSLSQMQLKVVKLTHGNAWIERVLYSKRHQNTYIERDNRSSRLLSDFCFWAPTFWDSVSFPF